MVAKLCTLRLKPVHLAMIGSLIAAFASQGALVVSGVVTARLLGPENRGHIALLMLLASVFNQLGGLGLPFAVTHFIAQDTRRAQAIVRSLARPVLIQGVMLVSLHALTMWFVVADKPPEVQAAAVLTLAASPAMVAQRYGQAILQGQRLFGPFNVLRVLPTALNSAALAGIVFFASGAAVRMVALIWVSANIISAALTMAIAIATVSRQTDAEPAPPRAELVNFGRKGFLGSVSSTETFRIDQAAVGFFLPPAALGLYVTALAFANLPRFISESIALVAAPHIATISDPRAAHRSMGRFVWLAVASCTAVVLSLVVSVDFLVPLFFGEEFDAAVPATQILVVYALIRGIGRVLGASARGAGHPGLNSIAEIAETVILVPSLALLVPRWGIEGTAYALVAASVMRLVVLLAVIRRTGRSENALTRTGFEAITDS